MKKYKICLIIIVVLILLIYIAFKINYSKSGEYKENNNSDILYNAEKGTYYITDSNGNVIFEDVDEANLYIYTIDPEYDPKNADYINVNVNN